MPKPEKYKRPLSAASKQRYKELKQKLRAKIEAPDSQEVLQQMYPSIEDYAVLSRRQAALLKIISKVPKTELHAHVSATVTDGTVVKAEMMKGSKGVVDEISRIRDEGFSGGMGDFFSSYDDTLKAKVINPWGVDATEANAFHIFRNAAKRGVHYFEVRTGRFEEVDALHKGFEAARKYFREDKKVEIRFGIILSLLRNSHFPDLEDLKKMIKDGYLVGIDIAGNEKRGISQAEKAFIKKAQAAGLKITIHAGEERPDDKYCPVKSVKEALDLGVDRLGHGIQIFRLREARDVVAKIPQAQRTAAQQAMLDDYNKLSVSSKALIDPLIKQIKDQGIGIEFCPTSNFAIGNILSFEDVPLKKMLDEGILISINTDDKVLFDTDYNKELIRAACMPGMKAADVEKLVMNGLESSFIAERNAAIEQELLQSYKARFRAVMPELEAAMKGVGIPTEDIEAQAELKFAAIKREQKKTYEEIFRKASVSKDRITGANHVGFDWWMFPGYSKNPTKQEYSINHKDDLGRAVYSKLVADKEYLTRYRSSIEIYFAACGWDIKKGEKRPGVAVLEKPHEIRFDKLIESFLAMTNYNKRRLGCFKDQDEQNDFFRNIKKFADLTNQHGSGKNYKAYHGIVDAIVARFPPKIVIEDADDDLDPPASATSDAKSSMPYKVIISAETLKKIALYKERLQKGERVAGAYFRQNLGGKDLSELSLDEFIELLVQTKKPKIFAESEIIGDGKDWNADELSILGDINFAVPVKIYDNGVHKGDGIRNHPTPLDGTLLFVPGALLKNGKGIPTPDMLEVVRNGRIDDEALFKLYERRLLPVLLHANKDAGAQGAFITIPGMGCGVFAGVFKEGLEEKFKIILGRILEVHGDKLQNIRGINFDPNEPGKTADEKKTIKGIEFTTRAGNFGVNNSQLKHPGEYGEKFKSCKFYSIVAWDHVSWPGNDFYVGARSTDDGVKAAATSVCEVLTGGAVKGKYDEAAHTFNPIGGGTWGGVIKRNRLQLHTQGRVFVADQTSHKITALDVADEQGATLDAQSELQDLNCILDLASGPCRHLGSDDVIGRIFPGESRKSRATAELHGNILRFSNPQGRAAHRALIPYVLGYKQNEQKKIFVQPVADRFTDFQIDLTNGQCQGEGKAFALSCAPNVKAITAKILERELEEVLLSKIGDEFYTRTQQLLKEVEHYSDNALNSSLARIGFELQVVIGDGSKNVEIAIGAIDKAKVKALWNIETDGKPDAQIRKELLLKAHNFFQEVLCEKRDKAAYQKDAEIPWKRLGAAKVTCDDKKINFQHSVADITNALHHERKPFVHTINLGPNGTILRMDHISSKDGVRVLDAGGGRGGAPYSWAFSAIGETQGEMSVTVPGGSRDLIHLNKPHMSGAGFVVPWGKWETVNGRVEEVGDSNGEFNNGTAACYTFKYLREQIAAGSLELRRGATDGITSYLAYEEENITRLVREVFGDDQAEIVIAGGKPRSDNPDEWKNRAENLGIIAIKCQGLSEEKLKRIFGDQLELETFPDEFVEIRNIQPRQLVEALELLAKEKAEGKEVEDFVAKITPAKSLDANLFDNLRDKEVEIKLEESPTSVAQKEAEKQRRIEQQKLQREQERLRLEQLESQRLEKERLHAEFQQKLQQQRSKNWSYKTDEVELTPGTRVQMVAVSPLSGAVNIGRYKGTSIWDGDKRGNKFRVLNTNNIYQKQDDVTSAFGDIMIAAAIETGMSKEEVIAAFVWAKERGGIFNKKSGDGYKSDDAASEKFQDFSATCQYYAEKCGLYSGREEGDNLRKPLVGCRLTFFPATALDYFTQKDLEDPEQEAQENIRRIAGVVSSASASRGR